MHVKSFLIAIVAPVFVSGAAIPQDGPAFEWDENSSDIVGGVTASQGDLPFIVAVSNNGAAWCGGSLINANTVVSAAHCYFGRSASAFSIRAGSLSRTSGGTTSRVASITLHPQYSDGTSDYDVAILKLSTSIPTSSTVSYATIAASGSDPAAGTTVTTAGWGATSEGGSGSTTLRKVDVSVVSRATCRNNYSASAITDRMFCAGVSAGGKDSCQGDSGGPIINSAKVLLGVVSWGDGCARAGKPGVYSNLGNSALRSFISSNA